MCPGHAAPPEELARARRALSSKIKNGSIEVLTLTSLNETRVLAIIPLSQTLKSAYLATKHIDLAKIIRTLVVFLP